MTISVTAVVAAFGIAVRDLTRPTVLWQALWPPLVAFGLWLTVAISFWTQGVAAVTELLPVVPWSAGEWIARWAAAFLLLAALASLTYATAMLLVAIFALPRLINLVALRDYPELGRHGQNVFWGSLGNTLSASAIFLLGWLLTLPLLLVPGVVLVMPLLWAAWLNQRTFRFDALAEHATRAELRLLVTQQKSAFYLTGAGSAVLAHVPLINLLAPAFTALVFVHLGLAALRRQRQLNGIQL